MLKRRDTLALALPSAALLGAAGYLVITPRPTLPVLSTFALLQATGWAAMLSLFLSLLMGPLSRLIRRRALIDLRRAFGIAAAAAGCAHAAIVLSSYLPPGWWISVKHLSFLQAGATCLLILLILWATSYGRLNRWLRAKEWRALHRLVYLAGALAMQHLWLSPMADRRLALGATAAVGVLLVLRLVPIRR